MSANKCKICGNTREDCRNCTCEYGANAEWRKAPTQPTQSRDVDTERGMTTKELAARRSAWFREADPELAQSAPPAEPSACPSCNSTSRIFGAPHCQNRWHDKAAAPSPAISEPLNKCGCMTCMDYAAPPAISEEEVARHLQIDLRQVGLAPFEARRLCLAAIREVSGPLREQLAHAVSCMDRSCKQCNELQRALQPGQKGGKG